MLDRGCCEADRRKRGSCGRVCEGEGLGAGKIWYGEGLRICAAGQVEDGDWSVGL